jgi:LPXTG-site transpeptidase (sortase) family protein
VRRSRIIASIAGCTLALAGGAGILLVKDREHAAAPGAARRGADNPVPAASPSPAPPPAEIPVLPSPVPAAPAVMYGLALPEKAPADERAKSPIIAIGKIEIPSINISHTIYEGVTLTVVDHGPGHWPGSAMPGDRGNTVFAGHRTTNDKPFADLDLVKVGDKVTFEAGGRTSVYEVTENFVVDGRETSIALPTPDATMTLFACHPKGSAKQRIVVKGRLLPANPA